MLFCVAIRKKIVPVLLSSLNLPVFPCGRWTVKHPVRGVQRWIVQSSRVRRYEISAIRRGMKSRSANHDRMAMRPNFLARCENSAARCGSVASSAC